MNRKIMMLNIALMSVLFASTFLSPASAAAINWVEHASIVGEGVQIDVQGYTPEKGVRFSFAHFYEGDHGIRDNMAIYLWSTTLNRWLVAAWVSDTDEGFAYISALMAGSNVQLKQVRADQVQVRGMGDNNGICRWSVPIEINAVPSMGLPAITIPPGHITLRAYGDLRTNIPATATYYSWSQFYLKAEWTGHSAEGFFVCPEWHYCGATSIGTGIDTMLRTELTHTATHA